MRWIGSALAWTYDFLAEDPVLLVGSAVTFALAALAAHVVRNASWVILLAAVLLVIVASIWRSVAQSRI